MTTTADRLYALLPAIHRLRDDGSLRALVEVVAEQLAAVEEDVDQLYDDLFIETCAQWVVPYLGDLVGHVPLDPTLQSLVGNARAEVADTIRLRRRKGTASALEKLAGDVTGWPAVVVEYFLRLAWTQHMRHVRPVGPTTASVRRPEDLTDPGGPYDRLAHGVDVRRMADGRSGYNLPDVGLFLLPTHSHPVTDSPAFRVDSRRFVFDPLGADGPLFQAAVLPSGADPSSMPRPIGRRQLRSSLATAQGTVYGASLAVWVGGRLLTAADVEACDLSDLGSDPATSDWAHGHQLLVAVDPVLGRLRFPTDVTEPVRVTYHQGVPADLGGGGYDRPVSEAGRPERVVHVPADAPDLGTALAAAVDGAVVEITSSDRFDETPVVRVDADRVLSLRAASGTRPVVVLGNDLVVVGGDSGEVVIEGLLVAGGRVVVPTDHAGVPNRLQRLRLRHCTLVPGGSLTRDGRPGPDPVSLEVRLPGVEVVVERCILGGVLAVRDSTVGVTDSVVDALSPMGVAFAAPDGADAGGELVVDGSTLVGKVHCTTVQASNAVLHAATTAGDTWAAPVLVRRRQTGYVRYSYVPWDARVPRRFACTPSDAAHATHVVPRFRSLRYGSAQYARLDGRCAPELLTGADDGDEPGAMHHVAARHRAAGLAVRLDEYLRFGLEAGIIFTD